MSKAVKQPKTKEPHTNGHNLTADDIRQQRQNELALCQQEVFDVLERHGFALSAEIVLREGSVIPRLLWIDKIIR